MKAFKKVLFLMVAVSMFLITGYLHAEEFDTQRDCTIEYAKKNVEENQDYLRKVYEKVGDEEVLKYIVNTNPPLEQAKYFVFWSYFGSLNDNGYCFLTHGIPVNQIDKKLIYSSMASVLVNQRTDSLKDVYFYIPYSVYVPKDIQKNSAVINKKSYKDIVKEFDKICKEHNKICFVITAYSFLYKPAKTEWQIERLNSYNDGAVHPPMSLEEYKSLAYIMYITQIHNPYSTEFSLEKSFSLPSDPKEQVTLKNTIKLIEEGINWMNDQATKLQQMGGKQ